MGAHPSTPGGGNVTPSTSAVIVAYHRPDELEALLGQLCPAVDQIVVVNVDDDPAVASVAAGHPQVVHRPVANRGYAAGVNAGAAAATGQVVCFMNDDLSVSRGAVERLVQALEGPAAVALPGILDGRGAREPTLLALPTPWRLLTEWALTPDRRPSWVPQGLRLEKWRDPELAACVDAGTAAFVAVEAAVLRDHPLPEQYFMYWEELEWFWDLRAADVVVSYAPEAEVVHEGGREDVRPEKCELLARNAVRCVRRTQGRPSALLAWPIVILWWFRLWATSEVRARRQGSGSDGSGDGEVAARRAGLRAAIGAWRELR